MEETGAEWKGKAAGFLLRPFYASPSNRFRNALTTSESNTNRPPARFRASFTTSPVDSLIPRVDHR